MVQISKFTLIQTAKLFLKVYRRLQPNFRNYNAFGFFAKFFTTCFNFDRNVNNGKFLILYFYILINVHIFSYLLENCFLDGFQPCQYIEFGIVHSQYVSQTPSLLLVCK